MNFWTCRSRLQLLTTFLERLREYDGLCDAQDFGDRFHKAKSLLARDIDAVQEALDDAGVGVVWTRLGGDKWENVRVIANLFNRYVWAKAPEAITEVERGIGIYERHKRRAFWQLFNPFAWVGEIAVVVVTQLVFQAIAPFFDKDAHDIAKTRLGKAIVDTVRLLSQAGSLFLTAVAILQFAGVI